MNKEQLELLNNLIEFGKIAVPSLITLLAVFLGARVGYRFSLKRFNLEKRLDFISQQVTEFYSPMVGFRMRIRASSELRVELSSACGTAWGKICEEQPTPFLEHEKHFEPFKKQIEDENQRFPKYLLPLYDQMVDNFAKKYWLAENSTKEFYKPFCTYVELWHRFYDDAIPPRALEEVKIEEKDLLPFYENLEETLNSLRGELAQKEERRTCKST
ncbi:MAG: hypothetical protein AB1401_04925 [Thermodesulfobacteriota bacterium]